MLNGSIDSNECIWWWWLSDQWFIIVYSAYNESIIPFNIKHPCVVINMCKSKQKTFWFGGCSIWVEDGMNHWRTKWQCSDSRFRIIYIIWLVVWTIFIFPYIGNIISVISISIKNTYHGDRISVISTSIMNYDMLLNYPYPLFLRIHHTSIIPSTSIMNKFFHSHDIRG